jgi:hypothetical protein
MTLPLKKILLAEYLILNKKISKTNLSRKLDIYKPQADLLYKRFSDNFSYKKQYLTYKISEKLKHYLFDKFKNEFNVGNIYIDEQKIKWVYLPLVKTSKIFKTSPIMLQISLQQLEKNGFIEIRKINSGVNTRWFFHNTGLK